ncbi:Ubiquitin carboxyl-terminal hydrolase isozyme L3-like protein 2 [Colletotrichum truncatum]|uniref:Ubiquitin carboxyl-terminal hydrolase isozyme L3-like protein 2 n=1 Tax=Colletotrichum truncatum TaxID=5467 RepID=A0ACC3YUD5_COLTU|nr:Ubiquitin carboxyl-terminal hydrolase isozyme L3-like protein 2 [Colletotrichum truncatum]KAF6781081.1 Ubiquitin carboxyl-terminal hydrolase isozyme L3-like protein 2 [Colletotrichum truncatum]
MPVEGVYFTPDGKKTFIPLENNPEVFTTLIHDLGISPKVGFYDVYSLDEPALLDLVPRPALALIFITPSPMYYQVRAEEGTRTAKEHGITYSGSGADEPVLWFRQTLGNACGLYALIHAVANGGNRRFIEEGSLMDRLIKEAEPLAWEPRADVLYKSDELEEAHMKAARRGDTAPPLDEHPGYHFIAYVKGKDGHLWELEGDSDGPVDRGLLDDGDDMLSEKALDSGIKRFLKFADGNLEFSIVAMAENAD